MTDSYTRAAAPQSWDPGGTTSGRCNMVSSEHQPWPSIQPCCCLTLKSTDHHRHCRQRGTTVTEAIIENLQASGAEGVILGCTEIPLLIRAEDSPVPVFDTTALHAAAAVRQAVAL